MMKPRRFISLLILVVLCGGWTASRLHHVRQPETKSLVYTEGTDTVGRESFTRSATSLRGDLFRGTTHLHYEGRVASNGTISRLDVRTTGPGSGPATLASVIIGRDSAFLIGHLRTKVDTLRVASQPGLLPVINPSIGLIELIIERARAQHLKTVKIPVLSIDEAAVGTIEVTFVSPDTAMVGFADHPKPMRVAVDAQGRILGGTLGPRRITILLSRGARPR